MGVQNDIQNRMIQKQKSFLTISSQISQNKLAT